MILAGLILNDQSRHDVAITCVIMDSILESLAKN